MKKLVLLICLLGVMTFAASCSKQYDDVKDFVNKQQDPTTTPTTTTTTSSSAATAAPAQNGGK